MRGNALFEFKYIIYEDDLFEFRKFSAFFHPESVKRRRKQMFIMLGINTLVALILANRLSSYRLLYIYVAFSIAWKIFYVKLAIPSLKKQIHKQALNGNSIINQEANLCFYEDEIVDETPDTLLKQKYSMVESIFTGEAGVYVYTRNNRAFIIPNHAFDDTVKKSAFIAFINSKMPNSNAQ